MSMETFGATLEFLTTMGLDLLAIFLLWKITKFLKRHLKNDVNSLPDQTFTEKSKLKLLRIVGCGLGFLVSGFFLIGAILMVLKIIVMVGIWLITHIN